MRRLSLALGALPPGAEVLRNEGIAEVALLWRKESVRHTFFTHAKRVETVAAAAARDYLTRRGGGSSAWNKAS